MVIINTANLLLSLLPALQDPTPVQPAPALQAPVLAPGANPVEPGPAAPLAQDPAGERQAGTTAAAVSPLLEMAHALPAETAVALGWNPLGEHWSALEQTGLQRLIGAAPREAMTTWQQVAQLLDLESITASLDRTSAVCALVAGEAGPRWVVAANLHGDTTPVVTRVETWLADRGATIEPGPWKTGTAAKITWPGDRTAAWGYDGEFVVFGADIAIVRTTLDRASGRNQEALTTTAAFRTFVDQALGSTERPLIAGYANGATLWSMVQSQLPPRHRDQAGKAWRSIGLDALAGFGFTTTVAGGEIVDRIALCLPEPRRSVVAALLAAPARIDATTAQLVPAGVAAFSVSHLDVGGLVDSILEVAGAIDPDARAAIGAQLEALSATLGTDLQTELLPLVGRRLVTMQWADDATPGFAALMQIENSVQFSTVLGRMPALQAGTAHGFETFVLRGADAGGERPAFAIAESMLVCVAPETRLDGLLAHIAAAQVNDEVAAMLRQTPPGTASFGWTDLARTLPALTGVLESAADSSLPVDLELDRAGTVLRELLTHLGESRTIVVTDAETVRIESRSPAGYVTGAAAALGLAAATTIDLRATADTTVTQADLAAVQREGMRRRLAAIAAAQAARHDAGEPYADLSTLLSSGALDGADVGEPDASGARRVDDYLLTVLVPEQEDLRQWHFAAVSWPANGEPGEVFVCTESLDPSVNDLLARNKGLNRITSRDLFVGGRIGGELHPGWRALPNRSPVKPTVATEEVADADTPEARETFLKIQSIENGMGNGTADDLIPLLASPHTKIAGRAAYALGKLKHTTAAPHLFEVIAKRKSPLLRRLAMEAVKKIRDQRSIPDSIALLDDEDEVVRALAIDNIGRLRSPQSADSLLGFLSGSDPKTAAMSRAHAVLALADIGDTSVLIRTAAAVTSFDPKTEQALVYAFQTLSPKLPADQEVSALMGVLDHPSKQLRAYSLRRLAALADPKSAAAIRSRLTSESEDLRPLVEVALAAVAGDTQRSLESFEAFVEEAKRNWRDMTDQQRTIVLGSTGGLLLLVLVMLMRGRSKRRQAEAERASAMVAPSEEYATDHGYGDAEYADGEDYDYGEYDEEVYEEAETSYR